MSGYLNQVVLVLPGGIDRQFENDVGNFFVDHAAAALRDHGLRSYTLHERKEIDASVRAKLSVHIPRLYDQPDRIEDFNNKRLHGREQLLLRKQPLRASVQSLDKISIEDWSAYSRILREERSLPIYFRSVEEVARNHGLLCENIPSADGVACFLRKKRREPDGSLLVDLHFVDEPERLERLFFYAAGEDGEVRICVSGRLLVRQDLERLAKWFEAMRGMPMSILIDAHPQRILSTQSLQLDNS